MRTLLLESERLVVISALARVELSSALRAAVRAGRLADPLVVERRVARDCEEDGPLRVIALRPEPVPRRGAAAALETSAAHP